MPYLHLIDEAIGLLNTEIRLIEWRIKYPEQLQQRTNKQSLSPLYLADKTTLINIMEMVSGLFLSKDIVYKNGKPAYLVVTGGCRYQPPRYSFNHCKSATCKFLSRDTKSARDKNGTKTRKNKVKNTLPEISLVEYLCFICKGTNLSLEKRGEIPISLIHNSFSYHCTLNVVIASDFDLKQHDLRKSGVKFCFALCWTFSKTRTGNRTKDLPPLLSNS